MLDIFLALTDLCGEPGGHTLSCNLHIPLSLKFILEVVDPLLSIGALLASQVDTHVELLYSPEQIISLLS